MKTCPKCNKDLIVKPDMFFWRGRRFTGLVCESCNALYENPEDNFLEYVQETKEQNLWTDSNQLTDG